MSWLVDRISWLEARHAGGEWLVRVDDLDPPREVPGAADTILRQLETFGLHWDGAVRYQSQRHSAYQLAVDTLLDSGKQAAFYPGALPKDPAHLLAPAQQGAESWLDQDYEVMNFAPAPLELRPGDGPPHLRLDRAAQFLLGDRL